MSAQQSESGESLSAATAQFVSGSFRDRTSRVLVADDKVFRVLTHDGLAEWRFVAEQPFFQKLMADRRVIQTREVDVSAIRSGLGDFEAAGCLEHERVPFISYPYEWSFGMLQSAAQLQLEVLADAIDHQTILKDATPYNVQFFGVRPCFIDVGSFERHEPGTPWSAYQQFCELFFFPLILQSYRGIDFTTLLRGELEGVSVEQCDRMLRFRDTFRPGVMSHVVLHKALSRATKARSTSTLNELKQSGFATELIKNNVKRLSKIVRQLTWSPDHEPWVDYDKSSPMVAQDSDAKAAFIGQVTHSRRWRLAWDLGCNRGRYSLIASENSDYVLAMDRDQGCVELLYRDLRAKGTTNVLPLVMNVANSSPSFGWRGTERLRLEERDCPDLVLCLGLIHHIVISANIPLPQVIDWLRSLHATIVLEFPTRQDPMVMALLRNKRDQYSDYTLENAERVLKSSFNVTRREVLPSGERVLFLCEPQESVT